MQESNIRSIIKTLSWRILGSAITMIYILMLTGSIKIGAITGIIDIVLKSLVYFIHERVWLRIKLGYVNERIHKS